MQRPLTTTGALYRSKPSRIKLGASLLKLFMVSIEVESDDRHGELPPGDGGRASGSFMATKDGSGEGLQQCLMWMVPMLALAYVNTSLSEEVPTRVCIDSYCQTEVSAAIKSTVGSLAGSDGR